MTFGSLTLDSAIPVLHLEQTSSTGFTMSTLAANASRDGSIFSSSDAQLRYEAYSRLQAAAVAFGESLPIPEIVAIGGQSDGKSSLLEAFLGVSNRASSGRLFIQTSSGSG
eukprot:GHUV01043389.1.p2 GENE.GHUV01043389.1~~GHUV01043389.1.p2  ORF type:complete len:111 (+),score=18.03 GHUV01043389.1:222-554(+)